MLTWTSWEKQNWLLTVQVAQGAKGQSKEPGTVPENSHVTPPPPSLACNEPSDVQSEAGSEGGEPPLLGSWSPQGDDTHADTVPSSDEPSPSSSQSSHHNDRGQLTTLFAWATYQTKRFKINKDTYEMKNNSLFVITLEKKFKSHPTILYELLHACRNWRIKHLQGNLSAMISFPISDS